MMEKLKEKGITLVALVVTIIIILILAGVTISQITGDNGLINRTTKAKEEYETEALKEEIRLAVLNKRLEKNGEISDSDLEGILKKYGTVEGTGKDMKLKPTGTSYEITYEDIMNGETISETSGGSSGSEDDQEKIELSKEEFNQMQEKLKKLDERLTAIDGGERATLTLDQAYNKNPKINCVYERKEHIAESSELEDTGLHYLVPGDCTYCLSFTIVWKEAIPEELEVRDGSDFKFGKKSRSDNKDTINCIVMGNSRELSNRTFKVLGKWSAGTTNICSVSGFYILNSEWAN